MGSGVSVGNAEDRRRGWCRWELRTTGWSERTLCPLHLTRPYPGSCMPRVPVCARLVASVVSDSLRHGLQPARLLCPWDSPGEDTGVGCHALLQGIFPTQGWNPGLLHCRRILYLLGHLTKWLLRGCLTPPALGKGAEDSGLGAEPPPWETRPPRPALSSLPPKGHPFWTFT